MVRKIVDYIRTNKITTLQVLLIGYASVVLTGSLLLMLPIAQVNGGIKFIDALFTAMSATCVTGLVVLDTGTQWTFFGQAIILLLIQIGGLGILAFITTIQIIARQKINLKQRLIIQQDVGGFDLKGMVKFVQRIIFITFIIEGTGALLLATQFIPMYGLGKGIWYSIFHSISAFCNAGFDVFGGFKSLTTFQENPVILYTLAGLIVSGGLGFFVFLDLAGKINKHKITFHTRLVLCATGALLITGILVIGIAEFNGPMLSHLSGWDRFNNIVFMAITPRTAGFTSVPLTEIALPTAILTIFLMFIGGSPGSTAGGIKTTTFAVIVLSLYSTIRHRKEPEVFYRKISAETLRIAHTNISLCVMLVCMAILIMTFTETNFDALAIAFEAVSAFGTVGSSLDMTPFLTSYGKIVIICLMFLGRVGPLTFALSVLREHKGNITYPDGRVLIG
ncbi:MAG: TrkH family potassium uptake protein [Culicoidibacterales bacterium]